MAAKTLTVFFALAFVAIMLRFPPVTKSGDAAEFTFAVAHQDMPSGVYYERDFDWPTGEAVWVDAPVWLVDAVLFLFAAASCAVVLCHRQARGAQRVLKGELSI
jgi:hypothetical protein